MSAVAMAGLVLPLLPNGDAGAAQRVVDRIDGFGPYKLGMTLDQAKAADRGGKQGACGEVAPERQCLMVTASVFEEPGVIYAVLDGKGATIERVVAQLDPQLTRRRAYRCVRLSEKVFALLVVVYGSKYKQSYDEKRRPLPAVAWDGEESGRLIFEAKCQTPDEGKPRISVIERYPDGVKPPAVASKPKPSPKSEPNPKELALAPSTGEAPVPKSAPIGVVEEIAPGAADVGTTATVTNGGSMAALARELAHAKGKGSLTPDAPRPLPPEPFQPEAAVATAGTAAAQQEPQAEAPAAPPAKTPEILPARSPANSPAPSSVQETAIAAAPTAEPARPSPDDKYEVPVDIALPAAETPGPAAVAIAAARPAADTDATAAPADAVPASVPEADRETAAARKAVAETAVDAPPSTQEPSTQEPVAKRPVTEQPVAELPAAQKTAPAKSQVKPQPWPVQTASLPPQVRAPTYDEPNARREPTDLEAPEPFAMPEEEEAFRRLREAPDGAAESAPVRSSIDAEVQQRLAAAAATPFPGESAPEQDAAPDRATSTAAPISLLSVAREGNAEQPAQPAKTTAPAEPARQVESLAAKPVPSPAPASVPVSKPVLETAPKPASVQQPPAPAAAQPAASVKGWEKAEKNGFSPVTTGGWRHRAPVPPARPWRERADSGAGSGA